jgi:predicted unusual protein kinase regulating ubiquinone biosynthesis (AarF/ABC1/UbiB family)
VRRSGGLPRRLCARTTRIAGLLATRAARHSVTALTNRARDPERRQQLVELRHRQTAARAAQTLGTLKGGAAKLGQLASFLELGMIPREYRDIYQRQLAALQDSAPPMTWERVRQVLREEWGRPPELVLAYLEHQPAAAASIGQVHRGRLPDGRAVAVKVQYPDVAEAFGREVRSIARLMPFLRALVPGFDAAAVAAEFSARALEELDYTVEGAHQARFARAYRGHPFIHVPPVHPDLTRRRVLVSQWVPGARFAAVRELPQPQRDRFGEILFRFYFGAAHILGVFNADPHPGNYLLREDGSVAFLDFGSVKVLTPQFADQTRALLDAGLSGQAHWVRDALAGAGFLRQPALVDAELALRWLRAASGWMLQDQPVTIDAQTAGRGLPLGGDGAFALARTLPGLDLPPDELLFGRMRTTLIAVLAQLSARANWHAIAREWLYDERPRTELGRRDQAFFAEHSVSSRPPPPLPWPAST